MIHRRLLLVFCFGCGASDVNDPAAYPTEATPPPDLSDVGLAYRVPSSAIELSRDALEFAAQALLMASDLSGTQLRSFGTLRENADGRVSYDPAPNDRLVIERPSVHVELQLLDIAGSGSDVRTFFDGDHRIRINFIASEQLIGEVSSTRSGSSREGTVRGRVLVEDLWWMSDLRVHGVETFDNDQSGSRFFEEHDTTGRLENSKTKVEVEQHWRFEHVTAREGVTGSRMSAASSSFRTWSDVIEVGSERFQWANARTQKAFRDGKPTELDTFWQGSGALLRNGREIGSVEKFATAVDDRSGGFVGFQVMTATGPIVLERHQAY